LTAQIDASLVVFRQAIDHFIHAATVFRVAVKARPSLSTLGHLLVGEAFHCCFLSFLLFDVLLNMLKNTLGLRRLRFDGPACQMIALKLAKRV
jgi:hypothetical protein